MDKLHTLFKLSEPLFCEMAERNIINIKAKFNENFKEISAGFNSCVKELYETVLHQQAGGFKKPIEFLYIAYLRSSLITNTYEYRLSLNSDELYLDPTETAMYWSAPFMHSTVDSDMEQVKVLIKESMPNVHASSYDIKELKYHYSQMYSFGSMFIFKRLVLNTIETAKAESWATPMLSDKFSVIFGGHMEKTYEL